MNKHLKSRFHHKLFGVASACPRLSNRFFFNREKTHQNLNLYCIGLPRSGTHSIAHMFSKNFKAKHEPFAGPTIKWLIKMKRNHYSMEYINAYLHFRSNYLNLDLESAHYLYLLIPHLVTHDKDSKFIFTVREPLSWLNSEINMNFKTSRQGLWQKFERFKYGNYKNKYECSFLENTPGLFPLSSYLKYYKYHIQTVINHIPKHRLLIIDTFNISKDLKKISWFAGLDSNMLDPNKKHMSKGKKVVDIRDEIDLKLILDKIDEHCTDLFRGDLFFMKKYLEEF